MASIRNYLFIICIGATFIAWLEFGYINRQKTNIEKLASAIRMYYETGFIEEDYEDLFETTTNVNKGDDDIYDSPMILDDLPKTTDYNNHSKPTQLKRILIWTKPKRDPVMYLLTGQKAFVKRNCRFKNCFIGLDRKNLTKYNVVLFNGPEVLVLKNSELPTERSPNQKYVFLSIESNDNYPICDSIFDGYFNLTWTYKFNSNITYGYIIIRNTTTGEVIGPKKEMHWLNTDEMKPVNQTIIGKLGAKKKLAAWMVSNCKAMNGRRTYINKVVTILKQLGTNLTVDIYGKCGKMKCPHSKMSSCLKRFEKDYYFYMAFENSFAQDYVTEKILHALQHYTIPVVYGTANYSNFMPEGSYINAKKLRPEHLVKLMLELMVDKEKYYSYFKWMNHYSFHSLDERPETDNFCTFCEAMNDESIMNRVTTVDNFYKWWNPPVIRPSACGKYYKPKK